jgi:PhzF family phenazine biosynthesis protein
MKIPYFEVDAFTGRLFGGNPAGVCLLERWLPAEVMQHIAAENNFSETAFIVPRGPDFELRWFTPAVEIDLAGHPTLASAFVLFNEGKAAGDRIHFHSHSGELVVARKGDLLEMDFPSRPAAPCPAPQALVRALGKKPEAVFKARDYLAVFPTEADVQSLQPDFTLLKTLDAFGLIVTALGKDCDFVSRFFAPQAGINEDPVTGSAHCTLIPYWAQRLGKVELVARQVSWRGGELFCRQVGDRVLIGGKAVLYLRGEIELKDSA